MEWKHLDPVVQIYGRRALQIRRACCKCKKAEARIKENIVKYATRHKKGDAWPIWYHDVDQGNTWGTNDLPATTAASLHQ